MLHHAMARSPNFGRVKRLIFAIAAWSFRQFDEAIDISADAVLGIKTFVPAPGEPPDPTARNARYEPLPYRSLQTIARRLRLSSRDALLDIGCGKGRVLCLFATYGVRKCRGIELSRDLALDAQENAAGLRWQRAPIEIAQADAVDADISCASVIFMYNPFSAEVMRPVLARIRDSLHATPRPLRICYANPVEAALLDECSWLVRTDEFRVFYKGWPCAPVTVWTARGQPSDREPSAH